MQGQGAIRDNRLRPPWVIVSAAAPLYSWLEGLSELGVTKEMSGFRAVERVVKSTRSWVFDRNKNN